jgi:ABC-type Fe3+/spermidine/putrescine transport system ATPase subunit
VAKPHTLRPERIRLTDSSDPVTDAEHRASGRVDDVQYLGAFSRVRVVLDDGGALVASVPSDELAGVTDGAAVGLAWPADAVSPVARSDT